MNKIKPVLQYDESDCGAACIATVLRYYGKNVPLRRIRAVAGTDRLGTSAKGIVKAANNFGLTCEGFAIDDKMSITDITLPAIFHIHNLKQDHYVVVYKIKKSEVFVVDPASGYTKTSLNDFFAEWSGVFFLLAPSPSFTTEKNSNGIFGSVIQLLYPHKGLVIAIFLASFMLALLGICIAFFFRYLIDDVLYSQVKITLTVSLFCYFLVIVFQTIITFCRSQILMFLSAKINVILSSDFFCHLLHLPMSFFSKRKTGEILSRTNDISTLKNAVSSASVSVVMDSFMIILGVVFLIHLGGKLIIVAIIPVLVSALIVYIFKNPFKEKIKIHAVSEAEKNASMYEMINGIATVKALSSESKAIHKNRKLYNRVRREWYTITLSWNFSKFYSKFRFKYWKFGCVWGWLSFYF